MANQLQQVTRQVQKMIPALLVQNRAHMSILQQLVKELLQIILLLAIGNNANANPSDPWAIAIGNNSIANKAGSIAIGDSQSLNGSSIAIGSATANGSSGIAMGFYAAANGTNDIAIGNRALKNGLTTSSNNIGIGANACSNVTGSNKICIGANSGPDSGSDWAKDTMERVFIGSKSKYNGAPAVLEVFNDPSGKMSFRDNDDWGVNTTGVVVNGNLIVKGLIYSVIPKFKDGYDCCSTGLHGRSGGQMESAGLPHQLTGYLEMILSCKYTNTF